MPKEASSYIHILIFYVFALYGKWEKGGIEQDLIDLSTFTSPTFAWYFLVPSRLTAPGFPPSTWRMKLSHLVHTVPARSHGTLNISRGYYNGSSKIWNLFVSEMLFEWILLLLFSFYYVDEIMQTEPSKQPVWETRWEKKRKNKGTLPSGTCSTESFQNMKIFSVLVFGKMLASILIKCFYTFAE